MPRDRSIIQTAAKSEDKNILDESDFKSITHNEWVDNVKYLLRRNLLHVWNPAKPSEGDLLDAKFCTDPRLYIELTNVKYRDAVIHGALSCIKYKDNVMLIGENISDDTMPILSILDNDQPVDVRSAFEFIQSKYFYRRERGYEKLIDIASANKAPIDDKNIINKALKVLGYNLSLGADREMKLEKIEQAGPLTAGDADLAIKIIACAKDKALKRAVLELVDDEPTSEMVRNAILKGLFTTDILSDRAIVNRNDGALIIKCIELSDVDAATAENALSAITDQRGVKDVSAFNEKVLTLLYNIFEVMKERFVRLSIGPDANADAMQKTKQFISMIISKAAELDIRKGAQANVEALVLKKYRLLKDALPYDVGGVLAALSSRDLPEKERVSILGLVVVQQAEEVWVQAALAELRSLSSAGSLIATQTLSQIQKNDSVAVDIRRPMVDDADELLNMLLVSKSDEEVNATLGKVNLQLTENTERTQKALVALVSFYDRIKFDDRYVGIAEAIRRFSTELSAYYIRADFTDAHFRLNALAVLPGEMPYCSGLIKAVNEMKEHTEKDVELLKIIFAKYSTAKDMLRGGVPYMLICKLAAWARPAAFDALTNGEHKKIDKATKETMISSIFSLLLKEVADVSVDDWGMFKALINEWMFVGEDDDYDYLSTEFIKNFEVAIEDPQYARSYAMGLCGTAYEDKDALFESLLSSDVLDQATKDTIKGLRGSCQ